MSLGDTLGSALSNIKNAFGLQDVNLFPGDVQKSLTGISAGDTYGVPTATGRQFYAGPTLSSNSKVLGASTSTNPTVPLSTNKLSGTTNTTNQSNLITGATGDTNAQIQGLNTAFDQNASQLQGQSSALDQQFNDTQNFYTQQRGLLSGQVDTSKQQAQDTAANNQADALSTAQDVQRQNRNMLRALGILSSSAGGELLTKPMGQYEKVRGQIAQQLTGRLNELNDFLNTKSTELSYAAQQARTQYDTLKNQIANDLRFNDRQRQDAIVQANQALTSRINDIRLAMQGYTQQVASTQNNIASYIETLKTTNPGTISTAAITDASIAPQMAGNTPITASIYDQKKKLSEPNYYG